MLTHGLALALTSQTAVVEMVTVGPADPAQAEMLGLELGRFLPVDARVSGSLPLPEGSYDPKRAQHLARAIIAGLKRPKRSLVLALVAVDLYAPGLNFVFGQADVLSRRAVISTARLDPKAYGFPADEELSHKRLVTEAVHEVGHLLGLGHCEDPACVMYFSDSLSDTDRKGPALCPTCRAGLPHR
jgi:archaemetzincin